jgi:hypothetical protein
LLVEFLVPRFSRPNDVFVLHTTTIVPHICWGVVTLVPTKVFSEKLSVLQKPVITRVEDNMICYYECGLCGYPIPFDPNFDLEAIKSGKVTVERGGVEVRTCDTARQIAEHLEKMHPETFTHNALLVPLDELLILREAKE